MMKTSETIANSGMLTGKGTSKVRSMSPLAPKKNSDLIQEQVLSI
jgi:hypothetical protein